MRGGRYFVGLVGQKFKSSSFNEDRVFGVLTVTDGETVLEYTKKYGNSETIREMSIKQLCFYVALSLNISIKRYYRS